MGSNGSIGRPVHRREDARILSGRSQFLDDVRLDGMAHMAFVRSPHACAHAPHPPLAVDEVRYVGQPVAAVVGETRALAEDAAERVEVDYEPPSAVVDPRVGSLQR